MYFNYNHTHAFKINYLPYYYFYYRFHDQNHFSIAITILTQVGFSIYIKSLKFIFCSGLQHLCDAYSLERREYYFDRSPRNFDAILCLYRNATIFNNSQQIWSCFFFTYQKKSHPRYYIQRKKNIKIYKDLISIRKMILNNC